MAADDLFHANRVLLTHFDSYSTALVFAKWGGTLLFDAPLPRPRHASDCLHPSWSGPANSAGGGRA